MSSLKPDDVCHTSKATVMNRSVAQDVGGGYIDQVVINLTGISALIAMALRLKYAINYPVEDIERLLMQMNHGETNKVNLLLVKQLINTLGYTVNGYMLNDPKVLLSQVAPMVIGIDRLNVYHLIMVTSADHVDLLYGENIICPITVNDFLTQYSGSKILIFE